MTLRVERLGLALIKGTRHTDRDEIELDEHGPVGDRTFCVVDAATQRVLRTVENPSLMQLVARDLGDRLALTTSDGRTTEATTQDAADGIQVADYWGRGARIRLQDSELNAAISQHLGREVALARAERGDVVYAEPISLVTTGALRRLSRAIKDSGYAVSSALDVRFRATVTVDADEDPAPGTRLQLGSAIVEAGEPLERCAVVDLDPDTGERALPRLLEHVRSDDGRVLFGVGARVVTPGRVSPG